MAIRSFGKADRGVQVSRWDPLPQGSPDERSADNRQGDGSIPSAATRFYSGQVELAHHDGLICRSSRVRFPGPLPSFAWAPGLQWGGRFPCKEDSQQGSMPWGSTKFAWIAEMD